jgi:CBS domain-containing protein
VEDGNITVQQMMTRRVHTIGPSNTLLDATALLRRNHISGLPVVDSRKRVVGVLSEKDIARALSDAGELSLTPCGLLDVMIHTKEKEGPTRSSKEDRDDPLRMFDECFRSVKVEEVMSRDPLVVDPEMSIDVAARMMLDRNVNRLPVVQGQRLVGILTRHDVLAAWELA